MHRVDGLRLVSDAVRPHKMGKWARLAPLRSIRIPWIERLFGQLWRPGGKLRVGVRLALGPSWRSGALLSPRRVLRVGLVSSLRSSLGSLLFAFVTGA